ncbi:S-layer homology domain-containing protein [Lysinibacillus fusiformis]|uniref:S-layer homology domain-containing protein n=1 Tax=Lysinibacillus fusiformis TaxID=28031 RepID=UPI00119F957D|nr:S-layer homology domain-containing protein [Lysinibacillus fusiformis]
MAKQNKGRKFFAASATAALVASAIVPVASAAQVNDYNKISGYAKEAVQSLVDKGVIQGDTNGNFNPLNTVTRAQAAEIFTKALELEADGDVNFSDVKKGAWYYNSIAAVVANGIFEGVSANEFAPNKSLTRSEAAKVLVDAFGLEGSESLGQFADASQVKAWAKESLEIAVANGIFTGSEENGKLNLKPNAAITRQDFAVVFARTLDLVDAENPVDASIKAINNTTVEVTFDEEVSVDDVKAANFKIEGLEVKSAAVKQTNKKVVVLTTAAQTADKEYVLSYKDEEIGKFKGITAVIPTAIKMTTPSVQGTLGKEATVSAQVTVPEGQSKAGIPVTFNIVTDTSNQLNQKVEVVAYTNEEGIASYSYTRYYAHNDSVTAYATDKASVFAKGTVYWADSLTLTEVTQGNTLSNGSKKVYKVVAPQYKDKKDVYVNITFAENVNVAPDKLVRDVTVTDVGADSGKYPYQVTTGGTQEVRVKLDKNGEATFTLTGSNATVTPIVFVDGYWDTYNVWKSGNGKLEEQELQAKAASVKFDLSHTLGLKVEAQGQQNAAAITTKGNGGRNYQVTLTDKDGKVAPDDTALKVVFPKGSISKDQPVYITVKGTDGKDVAAQRVVEDQVYTTYVNGTKGQVTFKVTGNKDAYATPTVFVDNGSDANKLDKSDLQTVSETTYFVDAVVNKSKLSVLDSEGEEVKSVATSAPAFFEYKSVDQNGFDYYAETGNYEVSYQVSPQFGDVTVSGNGLAATKVQKGTTATVKVTSVNGKASLRVVSADTAIASNVTVSASSSQISLEDQPATVEFSKYSNEVVTDIATNVNTTTDELTIKGVLYSYKDANYQYQGSNITLSAFEGYIAGNNAKVSVTKGTDNKLTFNVVELVGAANIPVTVTSATAVDTDGNGIADQIQLTFSKAVDEAKLTAAYLGTVTLTGGTVGTAVVTDTSAVDNKVTLSVTGATGLTLGTLTLPELAGLGVDTSNFAKYTTSLGVAALPTMVAGNVAVATPGTAGTSQVETLTATAATGTGIAVATVRAAGFNGGNPLNIDVNVTAGDTPAQVAQLVYNKLIANTTVTNFFNVTVTGDDVVLTAKTAAANDSTMSVVLANNVTAATSADTTPGAAPSAEEVTVTITTGATNAGTVSLQLVDGSFTKTVTTAVAAGDNTDTVASKLFAALFADTEVKSHYTLTMSGSTIKLVDNVPGVGTATTGTVK